MDTRTSDDGDHFMTTAEIVAALQATPMRTYDDLASRSLTPPPKVPGFYAWWQTPGALPRVPATPHPTTPLELLYVGIAPQDATSASSLRKRLANHHRSAIGSSTFRLDLTAFLWERRGWVPYWTDRPKLSDEDVEELATWQRTHLFVQWLELSQPWRAEADVVSAMRPPLNREHNSSHPFYAEVGCARECLRRAARSRPA